MNVNDTVLISSKVVQLILVPILRELAAVLLAIAISKDCKARDNGSGTLWGVFTILSPTLSGLIYLVYSRFVVKRKPQSDKDKRSARSSVKLTAFAILIYFIALLIAIVAIFTGTATQVIHILS